jgi:hypothetical protein
MARIMIIGAGDIGRRVSYELAHMNDAPEIRLVGRDSDAVLRATNLARFSALQCGYSPAVTHAIADVNDIDHVSQTVSDFNPDVIFLSVSLQSWWVISTLPRDPFQSLYAANFGPWLPMHLVPVMKTMRAIRAVSPDVMVVNAAYPDAVHPALKAAGLAPDLGIGNVANNVPGLRAVVADHLHTAVDDIEVRMVAHHYVSHRLSRFGDTGAASMRVEVRENGEPVHDLPIASLLGHLPRGYRRTGGMQGQAMTASSAVSVLTPLLNGGSALVHSPGPGGVVGGYPVRISDGQYQIELPTGMNMAEAAEVNEDGQRADGIDSISEDGVVTFSSSSISIMDEVLGYNCSSMKLDEAEACSDELGDRFGTYARKFTS